MDRDRLLDWFATENHEKYDKATSFTQLWMKCYEHCEEQEGKPEKERKYFKISEIISQVPEKASHMTVHRYIKIMLMTNFYLKDNLLRYDFENEDIKWYNEAKQNLETLRENKVNIDDSILLMKKKINPVTSVPVRKRILPRKPLDTKSLPIAAIKKAMIDIMDDEGVRQIQYIDIVNYVMKQGHNLIPIEQAIEEMVKKGDIYDIEPPNGTYKLSDKE